MPEMDAAKRNQGGNATPYGQLLPVICSRCRETLAMAPRHRLNAAAHRTLDDDNTHDCEQSGVLP